MVQSRSERRHAGNTSTEFADADWRSSAACLDAHPETFFPIGRRGRPGTEVDPSEPAKRVCRRCPVVRNCLGEALTHDVTGVWGGTTYDEREALRAQHGIAAAPIMPRFAIDSPLQMVDHMTGGGVVGERDRRPARHDAAHGDPLPQTNRRALP